MSSAAFGQKPVTEDPEKTWARTSKAIPFQNDSQWEDGRWQATDVGPFVTSTIDTGSGPTLKGIAIRVGDQQQAAVCFDTARLQISAAWTGEFLRFGPRRFGLIHRPKAAGKVAFTIPKVAGWANENRFQPRPDEMNYPEIGKKYGISGNSVVHLPKEWAAFRGLYTHDRRVILSYSVGSTNVLESPWYVQAEGHQAFIRSLEISPSTKIMRMRVADPWFLNE